jgi:LemA protein
MKKTYVILIIIGCFALLFLFGFGYYNRNYNKIVTLEETVSQQWSNVESVYQRRLDLIPNLVNTVKGYADFEKQTLTQVIEARAKATSVNIDAGKLNAASFQQFQQAQGQLSSALSRLMVVVEKYPDLKANQNFLELQAQLEGTENRIAVERMRYNETVATYNKFIKRLMIRIIFSREEKPYFKAEEAAAKAPKVEFNQ